MVECSDHIEQPLIISEIHYNPAEIQGNDSEWEFVEIYNPNSFQVDIGNWAFYDGEITSIPEGIFVSDFGFIVLTKVYNSYAGELPSNFVLIELNQFSDLDNSGESLQLFDSEGVEVCSVQYQDFNLWPIEADGFGKSLELYNLESDNSLPSSWVASTMFGGSPGAPNSTW